MTDAVNIQGVHHIRLTVTDVPRAKAFYMQILGFQLLLDMPNGALLRSGSLVLGLGPAFDPAAALPNDRFNENRVGLDHLSFAVPAYEDLEAAVKLFDEQGVSHGEINDIGVAHVLAFRDPDNIQLELSVPKASA